MAATIACLAGSLSNTGGAQDTILVPFDTALTAASDDVDANHRKTMHGKIGDATRTLALVHFQIPEYHDEQSFPVPGNRFGPYAYLYASPYIGGFTRASQIAEQGRQGTLAAIVYVHATPGSTLPLPYDTLHLKGGINCVWLATNQAGTAWRSFVSEGNTALGCVRVAADAQLPPQLVVYRFSDTATFSFNDFPAAARFGRARVSGQPLFGVKCLDGWCEMGPPGHPPATPSPVGPRERRIRGWHDEQTLGLADSAGVVRPSFSATIVPAPNLDAKTEMSFANWTNVAQIMLTANPPTNSKYERWGLRGGLNVLAIQRLPTGNWRASVIPSTGPNAGVRHIWRKPVTRMVHFDALVPGTARWRWMSGDDGVWVPCGQACCSADGGIS